MAHLTIDGFSEIKQETSLSMFQDKIKKLVLAILLYFPLIFWALVTLFPFYYMVIMATKNAVQIYGFPPPLFLGADFWENVRINYTNLLATVPFWRNMYNSAYIGGMTTILTVLLCSLGGFGFGMYDFKGKNTLFKIMLITIMIPGTLNIVPYFSMMKFFGWVNRPISLWLPGAASAFGFFLMKQYIEASVPRDLVDAARIDGCSEIGIYFRVILPLVRPMLGSLAIISFLASWNQYMAPLVLMTTKETMTVPIALNTLRGNISVDWGATMLGATFSIIPIAVIFIFFSRWIISSMTEGSLAN